MSSFTNNLKNQLNSHIKYVFNYHSTSVTFTKCDSVLICNFSSRPHECPANVFRNVQTILATTTQTELCMAA
jgi:hypothetical protein